MNGKTNDEERWRKGDPGGAFNVDEKPWTARSLGCVEPVYDKGHGSAQL